MKITRKGYYTIEGPDGNLLLNDAGTTRQATTRDDCYEYITEDGRSGIFRVYSPDREVEVADIRVIPPLSGDYTPDQFTFVDQTDVALGSTVTSAPITITGVSPGTVISVSLDTGLWSKDGVNFASGPGSATLNDQIYLRHTSSGSGTTQTSQTLTIGGVQATFTSTTVGAAGLVGVSDPTLSTNASGISDWTATVAFIDLMKMSRPFTSGGAVQADWDYLSTSGHLDADGWVQSLPVGNSSVESLFDWAAWPSESTYTANWSLTITWDGNADITAFGGGIINVVSVNSNTTTFDIDSSGAGTWGISISNLGAAPNHPRNIKIIRDDWRSLYNAGQNINPDYLRINQDMRLIRFMDWGQTNNSTQVEWADRSTLDRVTYANLGNDTQTNHVPLELQVEYCNRIKCDGWFCFPHMADDNYITQLTTFVRDNLDSGLTAHFELSNEIWNGRAGGGTFNHFDYFLTSALSQWPGEPYTPVIDDSRFAFSAAGKRAYEAALLVDAVYAGQESRRVNVLGTQTWDVPSSPAAPLNITANAPVWQAQEPGSYVQPASVMQAAAIAPYYGVSFLGFYDEDPAAAARMDEFVAQYQAGTHIAYLYNWLTDPANDSSIPSTINNIQITHDDAEVLGLDLLQYEGLRHYLHGGFWGTSVPNFQDGINGMIEFSESQEDGELALQMWNAWEIYGDGPIQVFSDIYGPSTFGVWGYKNYFEDVSPYAEMLFTLNKYTPNWWGGTGDYRNAAITGATDYSIPTGDAKPLETELYYGVMGHSLFTYTGGDAATPTTYTQTGQWLGLLAGASGFRSVGAHTFGQYVTWNAYNWSSPSSIGTNGAYDAGNTETWNEPLGYSNPDMTHFISMPSNFDQTDVGTPPLWNSTSAEDYFVGQVEAMVDNINITHSDLPHVVFIHYPDGGAYPVHVSNDRADFTAYNNEIQGTWLDYHIRVQDRVLAGGRTNVRFFPVGPIMAWLWENVPALQSLLFYDVYGDSAPHGTENIHLIQGMIFYRCFFGTAPNLSNFTIPPAAAQIIPQVANNLPAIDAAIRDRIVFHRANGVAV